jgi:hypothetical protein
MYEAIFAIVGFRHLKNNLAMDFLVSIVIVSLSAGDAIEQTLALVALQHPARVPRIALDTVHRCCGSRGSFTFL